MPLTAFQQTVSDNTARFKVLATGRRVGKTILMVRNCCKKAIPVEQNIGYFAPTYRMAKRIAWKEFKKKLMAQNWLDGKPNESELILPLKSGSTIQLFGMENYDAARGLKFHHVAIDEAAFADAAAWDEVIRATLADTQGTADFASSPDGRNWFYDFYKRGMSDDPRWKDWASFHCTTLQGGNVPASEIEAAMHELDQRTFEQEYEGSFLNFSGRAYYNFTEDNSRHKLRYDPAKELVFTFDFNVAPGTAAVIQEQLLPNLFMGTGVIDEVWIQSGSNTQHISEILAERYQNHIGPVVAFGDASGGNKTSQSLAGSDWDIIKAVMGKTFGDRFTIDVPHANPQVRSRINAVNSRTRSMEGDIRLMVDPSKAPNVVRDFEGTKLLAGSNGALDKSTKGDNAKFTHLTDGIGYYVHRRYGIDNQVTFEKWR